MYLYCLILLIICKRSVYLIIKKLENQTPPAKAIAFLINLPSDVEIPKNVNSNHLSDNISHRIIQSKVNAESSEMDKFIKDIASF